MSRDWNQAYLTGDTPWDKGTPAPPLCQFLSRHRITGEVLVPGCGTGHDAWYLAQNGASVTGLDIAEEALVRARARQTEYPGVNPPRFLQDDVINLFLKHQAAFDWVVEHTCLCAINPGERPAYARAVRQALRPGGHFLAIFYREVGDYDGQGPPHPITAAEIETLFGQDFERLESFVPSEHFPSRPAGSEEVVLFRLKRV